MVQIWRGETFGLLTRLAADATERWPGYAGFAALQERGLRKQALAALRPFAVQLGGEPFDARWTFVRWVLEQVDATRGAVLEAAVPHPLKIAVVLPTLRAACDAVAPPVEAFLWMRRHYVVHVHEHHRGSVGEAPPDVTPPDVVEAFLRDALARTASDSRLRRALAVHLLDVVEDHGHHLFESRYLGDPDDDLRRLAHARALLPETTDALGAEIDRAEEVVLAWRACRAAGEADFGAWCQARGVRPPGGWAVYER